MNILFITILALFRTAFLAEQLLLPTSRLSLPILWADGIVYFPSLIDLLPAGITLSNTAYNIQVMDDPRPAPLRFLPRPPNGPTCRAYVSRLARKQVSPVVVIPPRPMPMCLNRHIHPSFETPGPKSVVSRPFSQETCDAKARPVQFTVLWAPALLSWLLVLVVWFYVPVDAARPPRRDVPRALPNPPAFKVPPFLVPGYVIPPRKKVSYGKPPHMWSTRASGLPAPLITPRTSSSITATARSLSLNPISSRTTVPTVPSPRTPTPSGKAGLSDSIWAPKPAPSASSLPTASPTSSTQDTTVTLRTSPKAGLEASIWAPSGLPRPSSPPPQTPLPSASNNNGLEKSIWAPVLAPTPLIAPIPRRPFLCAFEGVDMSICSLPSPPPTPAPPPSPLEDLLKSCEARGSGTNASMWAKVPTPPAPCEKLFRSCEERDNGIESSIWARGPTTLSLSAPAPAPAIPRTTPRSGKGLGSSMWAPAPPPQSSTPRYSNPVTPSTFPSEISSSALNSPQAQPSHRKGDAVTSAVGTSSPALPAAPPIRTVRAPTTPSPPLRCEVRGAGVSASRWAPTATNGQSQPRHDITPPTAPPSPTLRCEVRGLGVGASMWAPTSAPATPPSPPLRCEVRGAGVNASRWAPTATNNQSQPRRSERLRTPPKACAPTSDSSPSTKARPRVAGAGASRWAPTSAPSSANAIGPAPVSSTTAMPAVVLPARSRGGGQGRRWERAGGVRAQ